MKLEGKLELTWVGKNEEIKLEPRILVEDKSKSYGDPNSENMLIHGDNLLALKALEKDFAGKIKCIYIDPPYNIDAAGVPYEDNIEHSLWLNMMFTRISMLKNLLSEDGAIFIQIDDHEMAYLKILCDEVFNRKNYICTIALKVSPPNGVKMAHATKTVLKEKELILLYCKDKEKFTINPQYTEAKAWDDHYNKYIRGDLSNLESCEVLSMKDVLKQEGLTANLNDVKFMSWMINNKERIFQPVGLAKIKGIDKYNTEKIVPIEGMNDYYAYKGAQVQKISKMIKKVGGKETYVKLLCDLWTDIGFNNLFQEGDVEFKNSKKPEKLIQRCFELCSTEGDFVLDSFLGSGTSTAVAHKMNRKWIGIELGEHAYTLCKKRMDSVIDGLDYKGISKEYNWQGGGGYKFYELAESLLVKNDKLPIYQINPNYTFEMICEAICKIEGFDYKQEGSFHGKSSENRFIHITTEFVNAEYIKTLSKELSEKQSLLIYSTKFATDLRLPDNIVVKKIPEDLLKKCKFESEVR